MTFNPENLLKVLPASGSAVVALSGGVDSVVLVHALCVLRDAGRLDPGLRALHVNHGLHPESDQWQAFCVTLCEQRRLPLQCIRVTVADAPGGLENAARRARYAVFEAQLDAGEVLLLAHHLDDQMETLLLRLMRGAGVRGLAGMPQSRALGRGSLLRPLLAHSRQELLAYASSQALDWIEDSSNSQVEFDRNFLRHQLLPMLESRWPSYRDSWSKSLQLLRESGSLLAELAASDLQPLKTLQQQVLSVPPLLQLAPHRRRNLLKHWLEGLGVEPGWQPLQQLTEQLTHADSNPIIELGEFQLRCYRQQLHLLQRLPPVDLAAEYHWNALTQAELLLPANGRVLAARTSEGGLHQRCAHSLQIRYRQGGEMLRLPGRPQKSLKKLLAEQGIPPWRRERLPLVFHERQLALVPGIGIDQQFLATPSDPAMSVTWEPPHADA